MTATKRYLRILWIALIAIGLVLFFLHPDWFTKDYIANYVSQNSKNIILLYTTLSLIRGLFLLPSTPFVFAGILIFPDQPWLIFTISLIGILITATYLYFASRFLEFDKLFGTAHSQKKEKIISKLNKHGFWLVLAWSFFPLVPTDLICYIAGSIRLNFSKYIVALLIGEAILVSGYIFLGANFTL